MARPITLGSPPLDPADHDGSIWSVNDAIYKVDNCIGMLNSITETNVTHELRSYLDTCLKPHLLRVKARTEALQDRVTKLEAESVQNGGIGRVPVLGPTSHEGERPIISSVKEAIDAITLLPEWYMTGEIKAFLELVPEEFRYSRIARIVEDFRQQGEDLEHLRGLLQEKNAEIAKLKGKV